MISNQTDTRTLNQIAITFISKDTNYRLPEPLRAALNNIFVKSGDYICSLTTQTDSERGERKRHSVYLSKVNSVYNALFLLTLTDTKNVKKIFTSYHKSKAMLSIDENQLKCSSDAHLAAIMFFQIKEQDKIKILDQIRDSSFNLFEQKLASPFNPVNTNKRSLEILKVLFDESIDWQHIIELYRSSESYLSKGDYFNAMDTLSKINNEYLLSSPAIQSLKSRINAQRAETEDAWNYFQKILN